MYSTYKRLTPVTKGLFSFIEKKDDFTHKLKHTYSADLSKDGFTETIDGKTYKWQMQTCGKHLKLHNKPSTRCALCVQDGHITFLEGKSVEVLDRISQSVYSVKLKCGHIKNTKPDSWNFSDSCTDCRDEKLLALLPEGTLILNYFQKGQRVNLKFPCGHYAVRKTYAGDKAVCTDCRKIEKKETLESAGAIENEDETFLLKCGHTTGRINWKTLTSYKCLHCEKEKMYSRAKYLGLKPTGNYCTESRRHEFVLQCGHSRLLRSTDIKAGVVCQVCAEDHYNKPCDMYFLIGFANGLDFIKVGIANDTRRRIKAYKNSGEVNGWMVLSSVGFKTKREAVRVEKTLHREFVKYRLDQEIAKKYISCGFTECYKLEAQDKILARFIELQKQYGHSVHYKEYSSD